MLDTSYHVETPEAIDLTAQLAGPIPRILAFTIDVSIRGLVLLLLMMVLAFMGSAGWGVFLVLLFLTEWFYPVLFEVLRNGQTPGKKSLRIAVVNDDLTPVTWSTSLVRNLLRAADILPFAYVLGLVSICTTRHFQRFGDLAAGSVVIHRRDADNKTVELPNVKSVPPPIPLGIEDQVAITGYLRRHNQLSDARKQELADILVDMTGKKGPAAVTYLQGVGSWLSGDRK